MYLSVFLGSEQLLGNQLRLQTQTWRSADFYPDRLCCLFELFVITCYSILNLDKHGSVASHVFSIDGSHLIAPIQASRSSALAALSL